MSASSCVEQSSNILSAIVSRPSTLVKQTKSSLQAKSTFRLSSFPENLSFFHSSRRKLEMRPSFSSFDKNVFHLQDRLTFSHGDRLLSSYSGVAPRKYVFWGRAAVFFWSAAHLNKNTKCRQLLNGFCHESCRQRKKLKLRANTVNLALKLGLPFGEFSFHNIYFARTKLKLHSM